jgi:hypothetical protein
MADIGMGGRIPNQNIQTDKAKEAEKTDRKIPVRDRENMAGAQQVETKHKKEEVTKTEGRFKAYKSAYEYLLGEEPPKHEVDEDLRATQVEEEDEEVQVRKKPSQEEIENYNARGRFKAKLAQLLGDEFDEEKPYEEENIIIPEVRQEDNKQKVELARHTYRTLIQYINDSIGSFDFDNIEDIFLLLDYGMPEDAVIKFIFLQQMARSGIDFPNVLDMSVLMYKFNKLELEFSDEQVIDLIKADYETLTKLKYTVAGFVYAPLLEVMAKIEEDLIFSYKKEFSLRLKRYNIDEFPDLSRPGAKSILDSLRDIVTAKQKETADLIKEKIYTTQKLGMTTISKAKAELQEKINLLTGKIEASEKELAIVELEVAKIVFVFSFINSQQSVSDFNRKFPLEGINHTLDLLKIRYQRKEIVDFLNHKISVKSLKTRKTVNNEPLKKSIETFETKIRSANLSISKLPPPKQQQMLKNIRNNSFEVNAGFYWLRQKNLAEIMENCDVIMENFE